MVTLYAYEVFPAEKLPIGQGLMSFLERSPASGIWYAKPNDGYTSLTLFAISAPATKSTERVIAIRYNTKDYFLNRRTQTFLSAYPRNLFGERDKIQIRAIVEATPDQLIAQLYAEAYAVLALDHSRGTIPVVSQQH